VAGAAVSHHRGGPLPKAPNQRSAPCRRRASHGAALSWGLMFWYIFNKRPQVKFARQKELSATLVRLKRPTQELGANAVWLEIRILHCVSSDRRHAGTEGAVDPTW